jgi:hypothetical protein
MKKRPDTGRFSDKGLGIAGAAAGLIFRVALFGGLNLNANVLGNPLDVLENLARACSGGLVSPFELLKLFLEITDLVFKRLDMAHGYSFWQNG